MNARQARALTSENGLALQPRAERPASHPLSKWLLPLGGALLAMGVMGGYLAGTRRTSTGAEAASRSDQQEVGSPAPHAHGLAPGAATAASRPAETTATPPDTEPQPAAERLTAKEARDRAVARMLASGPDARGLTADALRVGKSWSRAAQQEGVELKFDQWSCYRGGCVTDVRHAPDVLHALTRAISTDSAFVGWNGEKFRSGPIEQPDGKVEVTWILYAPADAGPALVVAPDSPPSPPPVNP